MTTILLLIFSNIFMTIAWYWHLKYHDVSLWKVVLISWLIAGVEYSLAVPANRLGYGRFTGYQLKMIQEALALSVFMLFAIVYLKESLRWNYVVAFALIFAAAYFAMLPTKGDEVPAPVIPLAADENPRIE